MNKADRIALAFGILFLFLIQSMGSLVEAIYILDLLKTSLDEKALGLLFFFAPALLFVFPKKPTKSGMWALFGLLLVGRGIFPYLPTLGRMIASGIATAAGLLLFSYLFSAQNGDREASPSRNRIASGLALALLGSVLLRTVNFSLDYSLQVAGGWVGWGLGVGLGILLKPFRWGEMVEQPPKATGVTESVLGIFLVMALSFFAFSAPAVMARWIEVDYRLIVSAVALMTTLWALVEFYRPHWLERIPAGGMLVWNVLFTLSLSGTLIAARIAFPPTPDSPPVIVGATPLWQRVLLLIAIGLFPVIFFDLRLFAERLQHSRPSPRQLAGGMLLGALVLVVLIFMQIFTNVWGYVEPVSPWFRNQFWLPYFLMAGLLTLVVGRGKPGRKAEIQVKEERASAGWAFVLAALFLGCAASAFLTTRVKVFESPSSSLVVMTYNIQQANDSQGERSFSRQLAQIEQINPDILALQESDSARVSLNNVDIVRYYAGKLGYYSYYGPSTVSGTYGTAILSRYPLQNPHVVFSYSDKDEIGTTVAEVEIAGKVFTIFNVHPDGTDTAMMAFAQTLLSLIQGKEYVIALGDYNLRDDEEPYQLIAEQLINAWESLYPSKFSPEGTELSGKDRIDHIFFSAPLKARQAVYILPPDSATDHPLHWAELYWER